MPPTLDYEPRHKPPPRRPTAARYWVWYYGGPRYMLSAVLAGAVAMAVASPYGWADGVAAGVGVFVLAVRAGAGRREW